MNKKLIPNTVSLPLSLSKQWMLSLIAFFLVAFGQPAWLPLNGFFAAVIGFALFWRVLLVYPLRKQRFFLATLWFSSIQLVQISWFISHPYWYIYTVYLFLALLMGLQFGIIALLITREKFVNPRFFPSLLSFLPIAALWTLLEWSRLFILSGFSWNPIGIAITTNVYGLQAASIAGIFGLSFWVILVNLMGLWAWIQKNAFPTGLWVMGAALPYIFGALQIASNDNLKDSQKPILAAVLVQTAFSPEESQEFSGRNSLIQHVIREWSKILEVTKKHKNQQIDLIVLPEYVVPFGTYSDVYPLVEVKKIFYEFFGSEGLNALPIMAYPFFSYQQTLQGPQFLVNNAYLAQGLANFFDADLLIGLQDAEDVNPKTREYYSSAILIHPQNDLNPGFTAERYCKRVLVPMGEYIPFEMFKKIAEKYGITGSFTSGTEAVVMTSNGISFSPSICYEETFGNLMREGRQKGAELFVNLTSDVWYPDSKLPQQHLDHARLRTVENGIPLIRACNTGITGAIDCVGRNIAILGGNFPQQVEWISDSLLVHVPIHTYHTIYSRVGDLLIIGLCFSFLFLGFIKI